MSLARMAFALLVLAVVSVASTSLARPSNIDWTSCPEMPAAFSAAQMECGWLDTRETIQGQPIRLRVAILRARPDRRDPSPVVYVPGGPGESAGLDAQSLRGWQRWQQQAGWPHDIVLFDPRGTGESRPRIRCVPDTTAPLRPLTSTQSVDSFAHEAAVVRRCLQQLGEDGMQALGPHAQIRDIATLLDGLRVERATLWGVSYGTRIARLFAQRYPEHVDTLVLDSIVPFNQNELAALPTQIDRAIEQLAQVCTAHSHCATRSPRRAIAALLARFERRPAVVALVPYRGLPPLFEITPYRLLLMILFAAYDSGQEQDTVVRIERALRGQPAALVPLAARVAAQASSGSRSTAVFWATRCALHDEHAGGSNAWQDALAEAPMIARYIEQAPQGSVCDDWPLARYKTGAGRPVDRPMLVLGGMADVVTPPRWGLALATGHASAHWAPITAAGHASTLSNRAAQRAVADFLTDRSQRD
ncbi:putative carboxylesterase CaeA protein [Salinisphaera shabanensis E1L3A]|uniref:Carboxylesterase CaeA protein n=1 Tax=Salinisphaera shabanensis E1L3A TaxID=1033802 RepID=U2EJU0_9GAMM|nr:alpha/beta hydrolase [Salinisphaera shabanensis]ERJ18275.1 putative carboxylesterase CaeA protein [Salinisphaera shabanensis E1L3A]